MFRRLDYEYNSSFAEYKYDKFKKRIEKDPVYPKTLSLEFAKTLIPKRGQTSHGREPTLTAEQMAAMEAMQTGEGEGEDSEHAPSLETKYVHHTGGITPVTPKASLAAATRAQQHVFPPLSNSRPGSQSNLNRTESPPAPMLRSASVATPGALVRAATMTPGNLTRMNSVASVKGLSVNVNNNVSSRNLTANVPTTPVANSTPHHHQVTIASEEDFDDFSFSNSSKQDESDAHHGDSPRKQDKVDFYKICALCELRLPRSSMEIKVFRKHVVKLRSSWDPKLVSKEIRSLDNTISMYNLVDVCLFCSQYFDPDFPDGIAYPVKIQYNVSHVFGSFHPFFTIICRSKVRLVRSMQSIPRSLAVLSSFPSTICDTRTMILKWVRCSDDLPQLTQDREPNEPLRSWRSMKENWLIFWPTHCKSCIICKRSTIMTSLFLRTEQISRTTAYAHHTSTYLQFSDNTNWYSHRVLSQ